MNENNKTLELKIRDLYKSSDEFKTALETTFGKEFFNQDITERINGWEDMLAETGRPDVPAFSDVPEDLRPYFKAVYKNVVMVEAYNEGERMDIYNSNRYRHYPWFRTNGSPSGFAFFVSPYASTAAHAGSGSRLSLKSEKLANIVGTKHKDICREMLEG